MTTIEAINFFGSQAKVARIVNKHRSTVNKWFTSKHGIPIQHQRVLAKESKNKLKVG